MLLAQLFFLLRFLLIAKLYTDSYGTLDGSRT